MNFMRNESAQKLRGGYYTPSDIARFLCRWVASKSPRDLLEPSAGDGAFLDAWAQVGSSEANVTAVELDPIEAAKAIERSRSFGLDVEMQRTDFLGWAIEQLDERRRFDAVVGNPPFVRYQYLPTQFQHTSERIFRRLGAKFTKHTNAWVPFIFASMELLRPGGRLAMVVPAEIIHVLHAQSLRTYLGETCRRLVIIDPEEIWFEGTLQGAVILMAEKKDSPDDHSEGLGLLPVRGRAFLSEDPEDVFNRPVPINGRTVVGKWTRAFLDPEVRDLLDELEAAPSVKRFSKIADVDVGIVTGANAFFLVDDATVERYGLEEYAHPMFGRSGHCPGVLYDTRQHMANSSAGLPANFIWFPDASVLKQPKVASYIKSGEAQELHTRYKTRIRTPWFTVPSVYTTEIGMLKRAHDAPRLILNKVEAYTTDTAYRITVEGTKPEMLVASFLNPLTSLSAELEGRTYGGGVLELVPSEIEKLLVPIPRSMPGSLQALDHDVRTKPMQDVLAFHGSIVLEKAGIDGSRADLLLDAWSRLRNRRQRIATVTAPDED